MNNIKIKFYLLTLLLGLFGVTYMNISIQEKPINIFLLLFFIGLNIVTYLKPIPIVEKDVNRKLGFDFLVNIIGLLTAGYIVVFISSVAGCLIVTIKQMKNKQWDTIHRSFITLFSIMISVGSMNIVYYLLGGQTGSELILMNIFALLVSMTVNFMLNSFLLILGMNIEQNHSISTLPQKYKGIFAWIYRYFIWGAIYGFILSFLTLFILKKYSDAIFIVKVVYIVGIIAVLLYLLKERIDSFQLNVKYNKKNQELKELNEILSKSNEIAVKAFLASLEAKDKYTESHSVRVSNYATILAKELGFSEEKLNILQMAGLLHDIGKIKISESILNKKGKLTDEEYQEIKNHPVYGLEILNKMYQDSNMDTEEFKMISNITAMHHERYDGRGYPYGLKGEDIPFEARILGVADTFDAMTTTRSYRKGLSIETAREEIEKFSGTQFCPVAAKKFIECIDTGKIKLD